MGAAMAGAPEGKGALKMAYDLIPQPKALAREPGGYSANMSALIAVAGGGAAPGEFLADAVRAETSLALRLAVAKDKRHTLLVSSSVGGAQLVRAAAKALQGAKFSAEAYALIVNEKGLAAAAGGPAGLFYAAATAVQLLERRGGRPFWPACTIVDWPDLPFRAIHYDLKHHMEKPDYLHDMVKRLAAMKLNALVLELEDKFLYTRRPEISAPVGLSADDLRALVDTCKRYHVEFVPLVQGLGHASYILKHPKYAALREKRDSFAEFCPQNEGTYRVLFDLYEEVAEATKGTKYFHIGGDEAWLMGACPRCSRSVAASGKFPLYQEWLDLCAGKIRSLGRVPMVWDDMLIKNAAGNWDKLPKDLFYVRWNYGPNAAQEDRAKIDNYSKSGLEVILAASTQTGVPYVPAYEEHFANIDGYGKAAAAAGLAGIVTTTWEDSGNHGETFWPGFAATAQAGWQASVNINYEFLLNFTRVFHRVSSGKLAAVYRSLGQASVKCYQLLAPGEPYKAENAFPPPPVVPAKPGGRWRDANAARVADATALAATLREARKVLSAEILSGGRRNSYALEVLLSSAKVMLARVEVFFALRDAELAIEEAYAAFAEGDRARASKLVHDASVGIYDGLAASEGALSSLVPVWERTRLPQDMSVFETTRRKYLHDFNNYGHLASKTRDLSYVIFVERHMGAFELAGTLMKASGEILRAKAWPLR